jgi:hypothetical protein
MLPALLALAVVIARAGIGARRLLAIAPAGTLAGFVFLEQAGGVLMLATWLAVAALALALPEPTPTPVVATSR